MTRSGSNASRIGFAATLAIVLILGLAAVREASRQNDSRIEQSARAIRMGTDLYALHCAKCHGSAGQGDIQKDAKALDNDFERHQGTDFLTDVITNGRYNTEMAAFALDNGGALNPQQIDSLVILIEHGSWDKIALRVQELGMVSEEEIALALATPVPAGAVVVVDLPVILVEPTLTPTPSGPSAEELSRGLYVTHCAACHGAAGEGSDDGPALITNSVRQMSRSKLNKISFDNDNIEGHDTFLSPADKSAIMNYIELLLAQPPATATPYALTEEEIRRGLYVTTCGACHGPGGEGSDDGPALNTNSVRQISHAELVKISFDKSIEGHDVFLSPADKSAIVKWVEQLAGIVR